MILADLIRGKSTPNRFATATPATFATQAETKRLTVASVATVAVAASHKLITEAVATPSEKVSTIATTSYRWLVHYSNRDSVEVACSPEASRAEIMKWHPDAVAAEPFTPTMRQPSAPLTANEEAAIRAWLALIDETDPAMIAEVMGQCQRDGDAREYFLGRAAAEVPVDDRRTCQQCSNFMAKRCLEELKNGVNHLQPMFVVPDVLQRCPSYIPRLSDPDRRIGTVRWPGLTDGEKDSLGKES
jgi:hypothetical protein